MVWVTLAVAFTSVAGLMSLVSGGSNGGSDPGRALASVPLLRAAAPQSVEAVFQTRAEIDPSLWRSIVIHHTGTPAETAASLDERHRTQGLAGLGYHFVIGNGHRMGDGEVHVGYRWLDQLHGAHVAGPAGRELNYESIGICLVGDGDRRAFTRAQTRRLAELVAGLCRRLDIPASSVVLHRDVAETTSPGRTFPEAAFRQALEELAG